MNSAAQKPMFIVDGIGPFFEGCDRRRINWSKIPFSHIEENGRIHPGRFARIRENFCALCKRAADGGFTAITLDDVAHLADSDRYPSHVRELIHDYQAHYRDLFTAARSHGLNVLLTTDIMFRHRDAPCLPGRSAHALHAFLTHLLGNLFRDLPEISGVIVRIGESDGLDVEDAFRSRLTIRTPRQARRLIKALLPVFRAHDKLLIFRTWSVGAHRVGDLIWNRDTFREVFSGLDDPRLIISIKYGESDFFRYLPTNKQFFRSDHQKIIEVPARREYEGCGEFPSFVGWEYEKYREDLKTARNMVGAMVWIQTGGWTRFRRLTYLDGSSVWNEINAWVTLRLFKDGSSVEEAIRSWCERNGRSDCVAGVTRLLRLSDEVVRELLYIDEFAQKKLFFRRLRVPPLLSVFWDQIIVSRSLRKILRCFIQDGERLIAQGQAAPDKIREMQALAEKCRLPQQDIAFMLDTFTLLAAIRTYYFRTYTPEQAAELRGLIEKYRAARSVRYSIYLDDRRVPLSRGAMRLLLYILLRRQRGYRLTDRIFTLRILSWFHPLISRRTRLVPAFARERAMGIDAVFK